MFTLKDLGTLVSSNTYILCPCGLLHAPLDLFLTVHQVYIVESSNNALRINYRTRFYLSSLISFSESGRIKPLLKHSPSKLSRVTQNVYITRSFNDVSLSARCVHDSKS